MEGKSPEFICLVYVVVNTAGKIEGNLYEERHMYFPDITLAEYIGRYSKLAV